MEDTIWPGVVFGIWILGYWILMELTAKDKIHWPWFDRGHRGHAAYKSATRMSDFLFLWWVTIPVYLVVRTIRHLRRSA